MGSLRLADPRLPTGRYSPPSRCRTAQPDRRANRNHRCGTFDPSAATAASGSFRSAGSNCPSFHSIQFPPFRDLVVRQRTSGSLGERTDPELAGPHQAEDQVLSGRSASEQAIKQLAPGTRILHLATHGFFLGGECASALDDTRAVGVGRFGQTKNGCAQEGTFCAIA